MCLHRRNNQHIFSTTIDCLHELHGLPVIYGFHHGLFNHHIFNHHSFHIEQPGHPGDSMVATLVQIRPAAGDEMPSSSFSDVATSDVVGAMGHGRVFSNHFNIWGWVKTYYYQF